MSIYKRHRFHPSIIRIGASYARKLKQRHEEVQVAEPGSTVPNESCSSI